MSNSVEFKAKIKQGVIEIPEEYQQQFNEENEVQVIVIKQTKTTTSQTSKVRDIIDDLTENPIQVDEMLARNEIYDRQS